MNNQDKNSRNLLNRKKRDPNSFIFTGKRHYEFDAQLFEYSKTYVNETKNLSPNKITDLSQKPNNKWLNVHGLSPEENIVQVCRTNNIHDLAIQDILDINQRPKFQEFDGQFFLTIKSAVSQNVEQIIFEQISFVFGKNFLISFQEHKSDHFEHIRFRLREGIGALRERGIDYLLFVMLESIMDNYFSTLRNYEDTLNQMKILELQDTATPTLLAKLEKYKKEITSIKRFTIPIRDFTISAERDLISFIEPSNKKYFYELQDLCLMVNETCDSLLSLLESKTNLFFSVQSHKMNQVMKTLTIVSTIFIPMTFVAGIYGMNFDYMPELKWKFGYAAVWIFIGLVSTVMLIIFKRMKWF
ncbi:MAG: magnesium/cobalt transporter CorA [Bacteroidales bacterium]|nr:magnesium/cobalt transporter CorA [Bacteroidales bacterium]